MTELKIVNLPLAQLVAYAKNARTHTPIQINKIAASIKAFGFNDPIAIDLQNNIIAGHARLEAAKQLKLDAVPTIQLGHLSREQQKAYILAHNRIALEAGWNNELLNLEIEELKNNGFDVELTGFTLDELENMKPQQFTQGLCDADEVPEPSAEPIAKRGDIWILGNHRLMCGDSTMIDDVEKLMGGEKSCLLITDPPYGVSYTKKNEYLNSIGTGHRLTNAIENDSKSPKAMNEFWNSTLLNIYTVLDDKSSYYIFSPQGGDLMMMMSLIDAGFQLKHMLIWVKNNHVLGRCDYNYKHEPILYGWKKGGTHEFYGKGQFKTSIWEVNKPLKNDLHPTMKPVDLMENAILNSSYEKNKIIDPFGGSGSTLIACEKTNRKCYMMEISPQYCDIIIKRWEKFTENKAVLNGL